MPRKGEIATRNHQRPLCKKYKEFESGGSDVGLRKVSLPREKGQLNPKKKGVLLGKTMSSRMKPKVGRMGPEAFAPLLGTEHIRPRVP